MLAFAEYTHPNFVAGRHHKIICEHLDAVVRGEIKRLMIEAPPRHGKSELASRRFPAYWMGRKPGTQIISASYNDMIATDIGRDVRNIVRDIKYRNVFGDVTLAEDSTAAGRWHTNTGGSYLAAGVGGTVTGFGFFCGIIDDAIKNREEADSERVRETIWNWYTSTFYTRMMPGAAIVMMTTRWHESDLAARMLESEKWVELKLPAIENEGTENEQALWPEWYPLEELHKIKKVLPARDWNALYQQTPRADVGTYIQRAWFSERGTRADVFNVYGYSDFAVTQAEESQDPDHTEHGVFGLAPDGKIYVLAWWHGQTTTDVWIDSMIALMQKHKPMCWFGEGGVIRRAVEPFLQKRMIEQKCYTRVEWINPIHDKAVRGRSFQGMASLGRVVFPAADWAERVINQCVTFPGGKHDDAFDVMSGFCLALSEAHPAIVSSKEKHETDPWRRKIRPPTENNWKIA